MSLISMMSRFSARFPTRREWWIIFHARTIDALLDEREKMIRKLSLGFAQLAQAKTSQTPNLQQIINLREEERTRGAVLGYRAAMQKNMSTVHEPPPIPDQD